ncbi:hypothetical protein LCM20_10575 [Halobacillus litoralis]|uniref:hypothetical protein n=1 Tax=Halobacillus litoralis TaxID=45668 RepID=UPI001CD47023|nr:hypothetical protein [Halobacillus litoralis]MCA0971035.1 hypothetical protein [Halobacillus litoralis]
MFIEKVDDQLYQLKRDEETIGGFHLVPVDDSARRIEKLEVSEGIVAAQVLAVFELIQKYAEEQGISALYVESHSDSLDFLLQHQRFECHDVENRVWIYRVVHT